MTTSVLPAAGPHLPPGPRATETRKRSRVDDSDAESELSDLSSQVDPTEQVGTERSAKRQKTRATVSTAPVQKSRSSSTIKTRSGSRKAKPSRAPQGLPAEPRSAPGSSTFRAQKDDGDIPQSPSSPLSSAGSNASEHSSAASTSLLVGEMVSELIAQAASGEDDDEGRSAKRRKTDNSTGSIAKPKTKIIILRKAAGKSRAVASGLPEEMPAHLLTGARPSSPKAVNNGVENLESLSRDPSFTGSFGGGFSVDTPESKSGDMAESGSIAPKASGGNIQSPKALSSTLNSGPSGDTTDSESVGDVIPRASMLPELGLKRKWGSYQQSEEDQSDSDGDVKASHRTSRPPRKDQCISKRGHEAMSIHDTDDSESPSDADDDVDFEPSPKRNRPIKNGGSRAARSKASSSAATRPSQRRSQPSVSSTAARAGPSQQPLASSTTVSAGPSQAAPQASASSSSIAPVASVPASPAAGAPSEVDIGFAEKGSQPLRYYTEMSRAKRPWFFGHQSANGYAVYALKCPKKGCGFFQRHPLKENRAADHLNQCGMGFPFSDDDDIVRRYATQGKHQVLNIVMAEQSTDAPCAL